MRLRPIVLCAVATGLVATPTWAVAKPKPPKVYCNLFVDDKGDGQWFVVDSPALDVVSADVATGAKTVVMALRIGNVDPSFPSDLHAKDGYSWTAGVTTSFGTNFGFKASFSAAGTWSYSATVDEGGVEVLKFERVKADNSLRWTIDRKSAPALVRKNTMFTNVRGASFVLSSSADKSIAGTLKYPDRGLSCVKPVS